MTSRKALALPIALALSACGGGSSLPEHTGYPPSNTPPWDKAVQIKLDDTFDAKTQGNLSFPDRRRAAWYFVALPTDGVLTVRLSFDSASKETDLGFEVLDEGFNVVSGNVDPEIGQPRKSRVVKDAREGKTYLHVYTLGKLDVADYKVHVTFEPVKKAAQQADPRASFPYTVPNIPKELAAVPTVDDTPIKKPGRRPPTPPPTSQPVVPPPEPVETGLRASIIEFRKDSSGGVKIIINRGTDQGVEDGWTGYIVSTSTKKALPKGSFKLRHIRAGESDAVVEVSPDDVENNRTVILKPPK